MLRRLKLRKLGANKASKSNDNKRGRHMSLHTTNYSQFKVLRDNRNVYTPHVQRLKKAMESSGKNFTTLSPVVVNEEMEILDGQHRVQALSELGWPVYYIVVEGGIDEALGMNVLHRTWRPLDFADSYSAKGNENYQRFLAVHEAFPRVSPTTIMAYGGPSGQTAISTAFRRGEFLMDEEQQANAMAMLEKITEINAVLKRFTGAEALKAIHNMLTTEGYNQDRMLSKLKQLPKPEDVVPSPRRSDNLRILEDIYNRNIKTEASFLRLF